MAHPVMMDEIISWQDASGCFKAVKDNEPILPDPLHFEPDLPLKGRPYEDTLILSEPVRS